MIMQNIFTLKEFIRFQTEVKSLWKDYSTNKWNIRLNNDETIYIFDRIAICTGVYSNINMPKFVNQEVFRGRIRHLKDIRLYEEFKDKAYLYCWKVENQQVI